MRNKKLMITVIILVIAVSAVFYFNKKKNAGSDNEVIKEIILATGPIQTSISTTGTVLPKNRLEVKAPVNGRIESILVEEGQQVKTGQTLAWMSSTDRAALLDAARGQGEETLKYWQEVYKPIPLLSPIDGQVIVATTQPGQTITIADAIIVLSDHLIVRAQVDETDIGKIMPKQSATIFLQAYEDKKIKAGVEHIYYESQTVNNVTIYNVDLLPEEVPLFFRSGMNATVDFLTQSRENALLIPVEAVSKEKDRAYALVNEAAGEQPVKRLIKLGITDDKNYEVISGVEAGDRIVIKTKKYRLPTASTGKNPFMPARPQQSRGSGH